MNRHDLIKVLCISAALVAGPAFAAAPAGAPAGSTGLCKDGSYYSGTAKKGACHGHKGVKDWWGAEAGGGAAPAPTAAAPSASSATATAGAAAAPAATAAHAPAAQAAPGGGAGQVWVNNSSKVYHCPADKWYGKTKSGSYMTEAEAKAKGYHPDHGKPCQ